MLKIIADLFLKIAGWKSFLLGLFLYLIFGGYVMPNGAKHFSELSGKEVQVMDLQFSYTPEKARNIINEYSSEARTFAIKFGLIADTVYPITYTFLFIIILAWICKNLPKYESKFQYLILLPFSVLIADYIENINLAFLFKKFPAITDTNIQIASSFTSIKWCLVIVLVVLILTALVSLFVQYFKRKTNS